MENLALKSFESEEFGTIRTVVISGEPYFVGRDVCECFGDQNHTRTISRVDEVDKTTVKIKDSLGRDQAVNVVNESGLYTILFSMQPQKAKKDGVSNEYPIRTDQRIEKLRRFKRWVTADVLPSIRKHGMYAADDLLDNPDLLIQVATRLKEEREKNARLIEENNRMKPKEIFADAVSVSDSAILIGALAKLLNQNGISIGQNRLFTWLRENGYLMKQGTDYNTPTQKAMELGLFKVKERTINNPDGSVRITRTTMVTGKGQLYFVNKFLSAAGKTAAV